MFVCFSVSLFLSARPRVRVASLGEGPGSIEVSLRSFQPHAVILLEQRLALVRAVEVFNAERQLFFRADSALRRLLSAPPFSPSSNFRKFAVNCRAAPPPLEVYLVGMQENLAQETCRTDVDLESEAFEAISRQRRHLLVPLDDLLFLAPNIKPSDLSPVLWGEKRAKAASYRRAVSSRSWGTTAEVVASKASLVLQLRAAGVSAQEALDTRRGGGLFQIASSVLEKPPTVVVDSREMRCALPFELFSRRVDVQPETITVADYVLTR